MSDEKIEAAEVIARHKANRHLHLYTKTHDDRLIWKAYQEFRKLSLPIPEEILKKLDEFAQDSVGSGKAKEESDRDIVEHKQFLKEHTKLSPKEINKQTAEKFDTTVANVKKAHSLWIKQDKQNKDSQLAKDFPKPPVTKKG